MAQDPIFVAYVNYFDLNLVLDSVADSVLKRELESDQRENLRFIVDLLRQENLSGEDLRQVAARAQACARGHVNLAFF